MFCALPKLFLEAVGVREYCCTAVEGKYPHWHFRGSHLDTASVDYLRNGPGFLWFIAPVDTSPYSLDCTASLSLYSRWAYIVRVCDTAPYPHYIDLAHYMISGLYSAGTRTIRD